MSDFRRIGRKLFGIQEVAEKLNSIDLVVGYFSEALHIFNLGFPIEAIIMSSDGCEGSFRGPSQEIAKPEAFQMPSPHHPENSALTASDSIDAIATDPATMRMLSELTTSLTELQPLASRIADLKTEILEKEASILKAILEKLMPLVPLLSEDCEQCYRREVVILTSDERVQLDDFGFYSEHRLILYENGQLVRTHRYGQFSEGMHFGWENTDEDVLTPEAAIAAFGFTAISKGLITVLGETSSMAALKEELEGRLAALAGALEAITYIPHLDS